MGVSALDKRTRRVQAFGLLYIPFGEEGQPCVKEYLVTDAFEVSPLGLVNV